MPSMHDRESIKTWTGVTGEPKLVTLTDNARDLRFESVDRLLEPANGHISMSVKGDATTTSWTIGQIPANCIVKTVTISVTTGDGAATTTLAVGISGTTGKYMTATSFTSSLDTAGVKTVTTIPIHETAARTVLLTSAVNVPTSAFRATIAVFYIKVPAALA